MPFGCQDGMNKPLTFVCRAYHSLINFTMLSSIGSMICKVKKFPQSIAPTQLNPVFDPVGKIL